MKTIDNDTFPATPYGARWLVMKFGGTSVSSAGHWETIRNLIEERRQMGFRPVIVHSALAGVSNSLDIALQSAVSGDFKDQFDAIAATHIGLARALDLDGDALLADDLRDLQQLLAGIRLVHEVSPRVHVKVMALGELMATRLGAEYLSSQGIDVRWVDARDVLRSIDVPHENERSRFLSASCGFDPDPELQADFGAGGEIVLTQGFIARNRAGESVLLGRGGSDTSAAYFAAKLQAVGLEIWTDVPGLFSADPRIVSGARVLKTLSYDEAQEIASTGGLVLHPRSIRPVRSQEIPLRIRCSTLPEFAGTLISREPGHDAPSVKAISSRTDITVVSMDTLGMWREVGFLAEAFKCFSDMGLSIDLVSTGQSNVTVTLDTMLEPIDPATLDRLKRSLSRLCHVTVIERAEVVSLVGQKIRAILHEIGPALEAFAEHRVHLVTQAASDLNLSFVVAEGQAHRLIKQLHGNLVRPSKSDAIFGPTLGELRETPDQPDTRAAWWVKKCAQLIDIGSAESAAYVYDLDTVRAACRRLQSLENVDQIFYAVKANNYPAVLEVIYDAGINFECVSPGEIRHVLELFPGIDRHRILFTPNFAPRAEYEQALDSGIWVTLDNLHPLREWGEIFDGHDIFLRIDTGQGRGHHEHVRTAGVHSKFGIPIFELAELREHIDTAGANVVGLHAHTGSGILNPDNWRDVAEALISVARDFPNARMLDLGGGLGIPEKPGQDALDMSRLDASIASIKTANPGFEFWLEPGRYLVAEAGVLLASVTQTKGKGQVLYVGVSTGMNSLIRPALYGAYHEIANLSCLGETSEYIVNVVGPICETGDKLGTDRLLPRCREGDVLLLANTGAYGHVMSSAYNMRPSARELAI